MSAPVMSGVVELDLSWQGVRTGYVQELPAYAADWNSEDDTTAKTAVVMSLRIRTPASTSSNLHLDKAHSRPSADNLADNLADRRAEVSGQAVA